MFSNFILDGSLLGVNNERKTAGVADPGSTTASHVAYQANKQISVYLRQPLGFNGPHG